MSMTIEAYIQDEAIVNSINNFNDFCIKPFELEIKKTLKERNISNNLIILDINSYKNIIDIIRENNDIRLPKMIIIFDDYGDHNIHSLLISNVQGFLMKNDLNELPQVINIVCSGGYYFGDCFLELLRNKTCHAEVRRLTIMERSVVKELMKDKSNQEIADTLYISKRTVEYHISSAIRKLNVKTRVGLAVKCHAL